MTYLLDRNLPLRPVVEPVKRHGSHLTSTLAFMLIEFEGEVWRWEARTDSWFFTSLPPELSADIREIPRPQRGFGSVRVRARIGTSTWMTSIFPGSDAYVLPLKKAVRDAESLALGDIAVVSLEVLDA